MSLVAYANSSDDESDEEDSVIPKPEQKEIATNNQTIPSCVKQAATFGHISDDDDDEHDYGYDDTEFDAIQLKPSSSSNKVSLSLPKPKQDEAASEIEELMSPLFAKLPLPRSTVISTDVTEEDDEFLHKKAVPLMEKPAAVKQRVKITIPSLKDFKDVDKDLAQRTKINGSKATQPRGSGLLSVLPKAKSEQNFAKQKVTEHTEAGSSKATTQNPVISHAFVPDAVRFQRSAHNTECVDGIKNTSKAQPKSKPLVSVSDSEESDGEQTNGDFFSLNTKISLPEVSNNEICALVAKQAAQITDTKTKYLKEIEQQRATELERLELEQQEEMRKAQKRYHEQHLNAEAMDALVGKNAKRRRQEEKDMQVIDIDSTEVLPDREEWMRTSLAAATQYQPTGVLNDEEPAVGTRRKHQITYLAHKAKANEAELQAMWATNRMNRRATQSKYGF